MPPGGVEATYGVALLYVALDTVAQSQKAGRLAPAGKELDLALRVGTEAFAWQLLASVAWPGSFIRLVVVLSSLLAEQLPAPLDSPWVPTLAGLAAIPFIVTPIDLTVHKLMALSVAPAVHNRLKTPGEWAQAAAVLAGACAVPPALFELSSRIQEL